MNRRNFVRAAVGVSIAAPIAACSTSQVETIEAQALSDLQLLSTGLAAFSPLFEAVTGVSDAAVASVEGYVSDITAAVSTVSAATTETAAASVVTKIEGYVSALISVASSYTLPSNVAAVLTAAKTLLPIIEVAVGLIVTAAPAAAMTPTQARAVLAGA